jgi:hypothetical protein
MKGYTNPGCGGRLFLTNIIIKIRIKQVPISVWIKTVYFLLKNQALIWLINFIKIFVIDLVKLKIQRKV